MNPEYLLVLFGVVPSFLAVFALVYALVRRQVHANDQEMFTAMGEEEPDYTATPAARRDPRLQAGGFLVALLVVFGVIGWTIFEAVRVSRQVAHRAAVYSTPTKSSTDIGE